MYKVITTRNSFFNQAGATLFAPNDGTLHSCLLGLQLMLNGSKTTVAEALNAGYRIVKA